MKKTIKIDKERTFDVNLEEIDNLSPIFKIRGKYDDIFDDLKTIKFKSIKLLAGKHNRSNEVFYWELNEKANIGDYAIVENKNDYDMVKVIGVLETSMKYQFHITKTNELKKVIKIIPRSEIRKD